MTLKLGMHHWVLEYYQSYSNDPDLFYGKVKFGPLCFCMGKKVTQMDFSETILAYDVKVGRYQRSMSFSDLGPRSLRFTFSNFFSLETARSIKAKFHVKPPWDRRMKICSNGPGHMTNIAPLPIW